MKQSFDERMGVMKNLVEQNTDVANKVNTSLKDLQALITKQQQDRGGQVGPDLRPDSGSERHHGRTQSPFGQVEQTTGRHAVGAAIADRTQTQQQQQAQAMAQAPPPDVLYNCPARLQRRASPISPPRNLATT